MNGRWTCGAGEAADRVRFFVHWTAPARLLHKEAVIRDLSVPDKA